MKILIATDGSAGSVAAIHTATRLAFSQAHDVLVIAVAELPLAYGDGYAYGGAMLNGTTFQALCDNNRVLASGALADARTLLDAAGISARYDLHTGVPVEEILEVARGWQPDLIVVGSHGRGIVGRLLLGSVSEAVLHRWGGSTLIARLPAHPETAPANAQATRHEMKP